MKIFLRLFTHLLAFALGALAAYGFFSLQNITLIKPDVEDTRHEIVLEKVSGLGKMELVHYQFQDVVSHEIIRDWLPDPKVMLFAYGEVVGCIDFSQVDSSAITLVGDSALHMVLPEPEICYVKIDHDKSRVYNTRYTFFEGAELVDAAYEKAEAEILEAADRSQILQLTKDRAQEFLVPMMEELSGRAVSISFPLDRKPLQ